MAYAQHHRVSFGGGLSESFYGPTDEIWCCNVNVVGTGGEDFDEEAYLDAITPGLRGWYTPQSSGMSSDANLSYVKCNKIGPDGRYADGGATHRRDINPAPYGASAPIDPDIISIAISWSTAKSRGPGSHGRIYPPNATYGSTGTMRVVAADQTALALAGFQLLTVLANAGAAGPTVAPVVASKVNATNTPITGVRVGNTKDVQRRRKDALKETYVSHVFDPPIVTIEN